VRAGEVCASPAHAARSLGARRHVDLDIFDPRAKTGSTKPTTTSAAAASVLLRFRRGAGFRQGTASAVRKVRGSTALAAEGLALVALKESAS